MARRSEGGEILLFHAGLDGAADLNTWGASELSPSPAKISCLGGRFPVFTLQQQQADRVGTEGSEEICRR